MHTWGCPVCQRAAFARGLVVDATIADALASIDDTAFARGADKVVLTRGVTVGWRVPEGARDGGDIDSDDG